MWGPPYNRVRQPQPGNPLVRFHVTRPRYKPGYAVCRNCVASLTFTRLNYEKTHDMFTWTTLKQRHFVYIVSQNTSADYLPYPVRLSIIDRYIHLCKLRCIELFSVLAITEFMYNSPIANI